MSSSFASARRVLARCRICLERDVDAGLIPAAALDDVDRCYTTLAAVLDQVRVELEAADPRLDRDGALRHRFIGAGILLALCTFRTMYMEACPAALGCYAAGVRAQARGLRAHLWRCLERSTIRPTRQPMRRAGILDG